MLKKKNKRKGVERVAIREDKVGAAPPTVPAAEVTLVHGFLFLLAENMFMSSGAAPCLLPPHSVQGAPPMCFLYWDCGLGHPHGSQVWRRAPCFPVARVVQKGCVLVSGTLGLF